MMACCPSIWWCTPTGPVEVAAGVDGVYTRPAGATGHPFKSLADALAACPLTPGGSVTCCCTRALASTLYLTLSGGNGTIPLLWNGTYWESAPVTLPCGNTVAFRYDTLCQVSLKDGSGAWTTPSGGVQGGCVCSDEIGSLIHVGIPIALSSPCGSLSGTVTE